MKGAIVIVAYHCGPLLGGALDSCRRHAPGVPVFLVDNSPDQSAACEVPDGAALVTVLAQGRNSGFAAGNNAGIMAALRGGAPWVLLLNEDAELTPGALGGLLAAMDAEPSLGAVQPAILRPDGSVNSMGNPLHLLGFSWAGGDGLTIPEASRRLRWMRDGSWKSRPVEVPVCSGAAVLLRSAALREIGLLEDALFLYHEDTDLSIRLRAARWTTWLQASARVVHHAEFGRLDDKMERIERNRLWLLLAHLRPLTLALLAPLFIAAEVAVLGHALRHGWLVAKLSTYGHWTIPENRRHLRRRRRELAALRRVGDWRLLAPCTLRAPRPPQQRAPAHHQSGTGGDGRLLILIPAFNESASLPSVIGAVRSALPTADVLVIDDGSTDGTGTAAAEAGAKVATLPFNLGVGGALRTGFRYALEHGYSRCVQIDGDGQHDPGQVHRLLDQLDRGADLVVGSRYAEGDVRPPSGPRGLGVRALSGLVSVLSGRTITDASSGFRAFSQPVLRFFALAYPVEYLGDTAEALLAASGAGFRVVEIPVTMRERLAGVPSSAGPRLVYNYLRTVLALLSAAKFGQPAAPGTEL